jgi:pimeloyl-ACP methyl ester carboxylesterase
MGISEGGPMSMLFAATYPERTQALVLCGAEVKEEKTDDWPWGESTREDHDRHLTIENVLARWGQGLVADYVAPSRKGDKRLRELFGRLQVQAASHTTPSHSCAWRSRSTCAMWRRRSMHRH